MLAKTEGRKKLGDDEGCFEAALKAVRTYGGILEHPEASRAWGFYGMKIPPRKGGWIIADSAGGRSCCVEQGHYGHRARKATWLYACGTDLPELKWGPCRAELRPDEEYLSAEERRRKIRTGICQRLSKNQRMATPVEFRDLLIEIAKTAIFTLVDPNLKR